MSNTQVTKLEKTGIADFDVFKECWKELESSSLITVHQLCLIYPISSDGGGAEKPQEYIIPCKLPADICVEKRILNMLKKHAIFYIDFCRFLPDEIYHRLICLLIDNTASTSRKVNPKKGLRSVYYSRRSIFFHGVMDINWFIEMEQENQRLMITVL